MGCCWPGQKSGLLVLPSAPEVTPSMEYIPLDKYWIAAIIEEAEQKISQSSGLLDEEGPYETVSI